MTPHNSPILPPEGLSRHEQRLRKDLALLGLPAKPWMPEPAKGDVDVAIIGAGMLGLCAAAALNMLGLNRVQLLDRAPTGEEGPWVTYARMHDLRTPKDLAGPALGVPSLTFRAWYEAQHGEAAFEDMLRIPRGTWMAYLNWYRHVLALTVTNGFDVSRITPRDDGLFDITAQDGRTISARHVVLATGADGFGAPNVPTFLQDLPRRFWAHSADPIDFAALHGRRVGVIGVGASALDNAATALEHGAARADIFMRRDEIPRREQFSGISSAGLVTAFCGLPDDWKWRFVQEGEVGRVPPPMHSIERVRQHKNAHLHLSSGVTGARISDTRDTLIVETMRGQFDVDFLIAGTGFGVDCMARPELAEIADQILTWADRHPAAAAAPNSAAARSPYLGAAFELQPKDPQTNAALTRIHAFNGAAAQSHGKVTTGVPAVSLAAQRLAHGIVTALFVAETPRFHAAMMAFDTDEIPPGTWPCTSDAAAQPQQMITQTET